MKSETSNENGIKHSGFISACLLLPSAYCVLMTVYSYIESGSLHSAIQSIPYIVIPSFWLYSQFIIFRSARSHNR